jgi:hypothetical protein
VTDGQDETTPGGARAEAFRAGVAEMPLRGGLVARERALARLGGGLLVLGPVIALVGYLVSSGTALSANADQNLQISLGLVGVCVTVAGMALFLRYSLGGILRLWLARAIADREG